MSEAPRRDGSILDTIKKMLGIDTTYTAFDEDIIVFINSAMMTLQQLGVGKEEGFVITGLSETWNDFLPSEKMLEGVKSYIYLSVKMVFDPPANSYVMDAMKTQKEELEWRLREQAEFYPGDGTTKGYWESLDDETKDEVQAYLEEPSARARGRVVSDSGFRARGGRYASDPDYPWENGPAQPAITEQDGG